MANMKAEVMELKFNATEFYRIMKSGDDFLEKDAKRFTSDHFYLSVQLSIVYICIVFGTKFVMRNREPLKLRCLLMLWNMALAVFSIAGTIILSTEFFGTIYNYGLRSSYCDARAFTKGRNGYWVWLFTISKWIELGDTLFVVLRKRPLIFLHWYHHVLTLVGSFYSFPFSPGFIRWGIFLNYFVHSFMYSYYFLRSARFRIPRWLAILITSLQIVQFVISVIILTHVGYLVLVEKSKCDFNPTLYMFSVFMDVSYLILFIEFFCHAYIFGGAKNDENGSTLASPDMSKRDVPLIINAKQPNDLKSVTINTTSGKMCQPHFLEDEEKCDYAKQAAQPKIIDSSIGAVVSKNMVALDGRGNNKLRRRGDKIGENVSLHVKYLEDE